MSTASSTVVMQQTKQVRSRLSSLAQMVPAARLSAVYEDQRNSWKSGECIAAEVYDELLQSLGQPTSTRELVRAEIELRRGRGENPSREEYQRRFPKLGDWLNEALTLTGAGPETFPDEIHSTNSYRTDVAPPKKSSGTATSKSGEYHYLTPSKEGQELGWLGGYRITRKLGAGGMGIVFEGQDPKLERHVAIKVIKPEMAYFEQSRRRFLEEAKVIAGLRSPQIVNVLQFGEENNCLFLVMPLLKGSSLADKLAEVGPLPMAETLRIAREIALGMRYAHKQNIVHRDIKPSNLWLEEVPGEPDRVVVLDFGLAKLMEGDPGAGVSVTGQGIGTPGYMAPEQADGKKVDERADLFSLGCVLYQMVTGTPPFMGKTTLEILKKVGMHEPPEASTVNPQVPPGLSKLIKRLMAKERDERPANAQEVLNALEAVQVELVAVTGAVPQDFKVEDRSIGNVRAATTSVPRPLPRVVQKKVKNGRKPLLIGGAAVGVVSLGALIYALTRPGDKPRVDPNPGKSEVVVKPQIGDDGKTLQPAGDVKFKGTLDVWVWNPKTLAKSSLRNAVPLKPGDLIRISAQVEPAGYMYLLWVDTEGEIDPIYPWDSEWKRRSVEKKHSRFELPEETYQGAEINPGGNGMETVILLVRDTPLPEDTDLKQALGQLPPQRPFENPRALIWFENGFLVREKDDLDRGPQFYTNTKGIADPSLILQDMIRRKLSPLFPYSRSVAFAKRSD